MRCNLLVPLAVSLLFLGNAYGQEKAERYLCADGPGQGTEVATHKFRQLGETIEISISGAGVPAAVADCDPVVLELHWANGRNNGSNFNVTFLDGNNRPLFVRQISGFRAGMIQFPLSSFDGPRVSRLSMGMFSVPTTIAIQAVRPFAAPASLSYSVTWVARASKYENEKEGREKGEAVGARLREERRQGNEIVSIRHVTRLIGASRLPVVQIELKTSRPFPVREVPLQLQIGKKVFVDELSGDYTGRTLMLNLTPEMFDELKDGDEIVASFGKPDPGGSANQDVWYFGKLSKAVGSGQ